MRRSISKRPLRKKAVAGVLAVAALAATASLAAAQAVAPAPDGGPANPPAAPAGAVTTTCGPLQTSIVTTHNGPRTMNATAFQSLPGAVGRFTVPAGQSRCVKLLFTAETACGLTGGPDFCYVQAVIDGNPMNPDGTGFQAIDSEKGTARGHAYEWVKRVGPGNHTIAVQWRVLAAGTPFYVDDSTFDVQLHL
jgi:hypothetical protein